MHRRGCGPGPPWLGGLLLLGHLGSPAGNGRVLCRWLRAGQRAPVLGGGTGGGHQGRPAGRPQGLLEASQEG